MCPHTSKMVHRRRLFWSAVSRPGREAEERAGGGEGADGDGGAAGARGGRRREGPGGLRAEDPGREDPCAVRAFRARREGPAAVDVSTSGSVSDTFERSARVQRREVLSTVTFYCALRASWTLFWIFSNPMCVPAQCVELTWFQRRPRRSTSTWIKDTFKRYV